MAELRIGILTHNYPKTINDRQDAGICIYDFAQELAKRAKVFILCPNFIGKKESFKKVPVTWFNWAGGKEKLGSWKIYNPFSVFKFINLMQEGKSATIDFIRKNKIDICIAMWALPAGVWAEYAKDKLNIPYAIFSHGSDINYYANFPILKKVIQSALKQADWRFAVGRELRQKTTKLSQSNCHYLPITTNLPLNIGRKINLKKSFNFLFVGRLEKFKGVDLLIKACRDLILDKQKFHLYFLGSGSLENYLKRKITDYQLENFVTLFGQANLDEVSSFMKSADCLIIPSRSESLSLVLTEAITSKLPVVTTDVGDCGYFVKKYHLGLISKEVNVKSISQTMKKAIKIAQLRSREFYSGQKEFTSLFTLSGSVEKLLKTLLS